MLDGWDRLRGRGGHAHRRHVRFHRRAWWLLLDVRDASAGLRRRFSRQRALAASALALALLAVAAVWMGVPGGGDEDGGPTEPVAAAAADSGDVKGAEADSVAHGRADKAKRPRGSERAGDERDAASDRRRKPHAKRRGGAKDRDSKLDRRARATGERRRAAGGRAEGRSSAGGRSPSGGGRSPSATPAPVPPRSSAPAPAPSAPATGPTPAPSPQASPPSRGDGNRGGSSPTGPKEPKGTKPDEDAAGADD